MSQLLTTYSFTEEDINLITHALRRYAEITGFCTSVADAKNLIEFIERQKKEKGIN